MVSNATRRATIRFVVGEAIAGLAAAFNFVRWMQSTRPDARVEAKIWLVLCVLSVALGFSYFLYYRNRRNYFAEEMEHKRSLAKDR